MSRKPVAVSATAPGARQGRTALSLLDPLAGLNARPLPNAQRRLRALTARVRQELRWLDYPVMSWVTPRTHASGQHVYDVVIVGAGQGGLAMAFGLRREKVNNILVVDRAAPEREGPWVTYARMLTFRSPKHVTGPDLGVAALTPQAWYEAVYGVRAWQALGKWPREVWQDYLNWYRATLDLPVRNHTDVVRITPDGDLLRLDTRATGELGMTGSILARKIVLSTGIEGNGDWQLPDLSLDRLPASRYAHTNWEFDAASLRGRRVAVLGAGASAFDTAGALLEAGAAEVHQFVRRRSIPSVNPFRLMERSGFLRHFGSMDDATRWRWMQAIAANGQPPTQDGVNRCAAFANYHLSLGVSWTDVRMIGDTVRITISDGSVYDCDYIVLGTGYFVDVARRAELAGLAEHIALWRDRYTPPSDEADSLVAGHPYLGPDLAFQEKVPGAAPYLHNIHNFTYSATASVGYSGASLTGMKYGIQRLLEGITRFLWLQEAESCLGEIIAYRDIDLDVAPLAPRQVRAARAA